MLKFPTNGGIVTIRSTILIPVECATMITSSKEIPKEVGVRHENCKVALHPNFPDQEVAIEGMLSAKERTELYSLLKENLDIFAWQPSNMTGERGQATERAKAIQAEVQKLVKAEIDWKVESLCGYPFKCFLDAYKGYHQIQLAESDEEKTAFHTGQRVYCYTKMPFCLKNDGATYQRLVDKAFDNQIGQNIEVYVDNLVIKSHTEAEMLRDIGEMFQLLDESPPDALVVETQQEPWTLFTDGSSCIDMSGAGLILTSPEGTEFTYELRFLFAASNNEAEYKAIIAGVRITAQMGVQNIHVSVDSKLVANKVLGAYVAKVKKNDQIPGEGQKPGQRLHQLFYKPSTTKQKQESRCPDDRNEERKLRIKARQNELLEGVLYRRSFFTPWLRCVGPLQADYVIREIHEGSCSMHAGPLSVVAKAIRLGYYWPTMHRDARDMIPLWPFYKCRIDIASPSLEAPAKDKLKMTKYYSARVCGVTFMPRDFVYCSNDASHAVDGRNLRLKWGGPYEVTEALGDGAYKLRSNIHVIGMSRKRVATLAATDSES
uniref:Reverse transcriptase domain-containing protein n=1 Tax=Tanacetum cinerariifolium TaxID=118510 RepID=A0A6L2MG74_TANCI|nr:reverse transcriptase domain-containing protein [Tanacetum cinerariifolium]